MAGTSYQISIGADFKELDGAFNSINRAIGQVSKTAAQFESAFKGALHGVENQTSRLQNAVRSVLRETSKLASSASPLGGAELGFKTSKFRSQLSDYGLPQDRIDGLIANYEEANGAAIANLSKQIAEARQASFAKLLQDNLNETKRLAEYAKQILHEGRLDNTIHRDTRDVYAKLQSLAKSAGVGDIGGQLEQIRIHTAQVIQREIENLKSDALAAGRAIKAADITRVESRIGSYREVLGTGEVARLRDLLQNTVSSVAGELQVKSTQGLLDAIQNVVENVTLSSKQLKAQLDSFRTQGESLGIQGSMFDGLDEVKRLTARIQEVERQELLQFQKDTRKRITDNLREILQKTSVDLQQIHKLSADFKQAGGTSGDFAAKGTQGILSELVKRVADMKLKGQEFTRELERYYENLFRAVGVEGNQLASLVGFVKTNASAVNSNAATMRMNAMRSEIAKIFVSYNRVNEAISKAIMDRMRRDWASVSSTDFNSEFASGLRGQETIIKRGEIKQAMEGIWKPFQKQLADLTELKAFLQRNNAASLEAYTSQIGPTLLRNLERQFASVKAALAEQSSGRHASLSSAEANSIRIELEGMLDEVGTDVDRKVAIELSRRMSQIRAQLRQVQAGNASAMPDIKGVNATLAQAAKEASVKNDAQLQLRLNNTRKLLDDVTAQLAQNDAVKRAKAALMSGTRRLGGEDALKLQLTEIQKAYGELIKAVKHVDKELAKKLGLQAKALQQQAREQFNRTSGRTSSGKGDDPYGMHPGIIANYRRQIPMQITDIVVGLSTGQLPLYVLLQQGGQLRDMFGGIGNAVKEVSKYLLGWKDDMSAAAKAGAVLKRVFAGVAVGAIAGAAMLMKKAADFNAQIRNTTVELRFRGSDVSGDEFRDYSERMSRSLGIARTNAAAIFKQIAIDAKLPKESFDSLIDGLEDISTALGNGWDTKGLQETVKLLGESFKDKDSFLEFASNYAVFNKEQYESIKNLYDQGDAAKATALAMQTLAKNTQGAAQEAMTPFQETVKTAKEELLRQLQVVGDGLPWEAFQSNIKNTAKLVADFIGIILKGTSALINFVQFLGNKAVSSAFKFGAVWKTAGSVDAANAAAGAVKLQEHHMQESLRAAARGDLELAEASRKTAEHFSKQALDFADKAKRDADAAANLKDIYENQLDPKALDAYSAAVESLGLGVEKAASGMTVAVKSAKEIAGLQIHPNPNDKNNKGNKRGSGSRGGKSQMEKDADAAEKYILKLQEAWENYKKLTKVEQLSFDLEHGKVKMTAEQIARAQTLAQMYDERARAEAEELRVMERQTLALQKQAEIRNKIQEYALQMARMQRADVVVDYYQELLNYDTQLTQRIDEFNQRRRREVRDARNNGRSNEIADIERYFDDLIASERDKIEKLKQVYKEAYWERVRLGTSWGTGFEKGLDQTAFKVIELSEEVSSAVQGWADKMGESLATFVRTGKLSFKDLATSILDDIARIAANDFVRNLIGGFKYGFGTPIAASGHEEVKDRVDKFKTIAGVQRVWVDNMPSGLGDIGSITSSVFGKNTDFRLGNPTSLFGNIQTPTFVDFSSANRIGEQVGNITASQIAPVVEANSRGMFSTLTSGLGNIFNNIFNGIGNVFSGFGGGGGSGISGFFGSLFSGIGSFFSNLFGFASGGYTGIGGKYTPAGVVHKGEFVINAASTRKLGLDFLNRLNGYADGGYVSPTPPIVHSGYGRDAGAGLEVNIYNQGTDNVRAERNSSGGLDIFIEQAVNAVAGNIAAGGTVAAAMQRTYALNRGAGVQRSGY